jgi:hypothetical protein
MTTDHDDLIQRITAFRERHDMAPSTFGMLAVNSGNLLSKMGEGRNPRAKTVLRILAFMDRYEEDQRKTDLAAIGLIRKSGFVRLESDGEPRLETNTQIDAKTFRRLVAKGYLEPAGDALFRGMTQTYRPVEALHGA